MHVCLPACLHDTSIKCSNMIEQTCVHVHTSSSCILEQCMAILAIRSCSVHAPV